MLRSFSIATAAVVKMVRSFFWEAGEGGGERGREEFQLFWLRVIFIWSISMMLEFSFQKKLFNIDLFLWKLAFLHRKRCGNVSFSAFALFIWNLICNYSRILRLVFSEATRRTDCNNCLLMLFCRLWSEVAANGAVDDWKMKFEYWLARMVEMGMIRCSKHLNYCCVAYASVLSICWKCIYVGASQGLSLVSRLWEKTTKT